MEQRSKRDDWQQLIGRTHTARLLHGAARLADDAGIPADVALGLLGECRESDRGILEQLLRETRY